MTQFQEKKFSRIIKTPGIDNLGDIEGLIGDKYMDIKRWVIMCNCNSIESNIILENMKWQQFDESFINLCNGDSTRLIERIFYDKVNQIDSSIVVASKDLNFSAAARAVFLTSSGTPANSASVTKRENLSVASKAFSLNF